MPQHFFNVARRVTTPRHHLPTPRCRIGQAFALRMAARISPSTHDDLDATPRMASMARTSSGDTMMGTLTPRRSLGAIFGRPGPRLVSMRKLYHAFHLPSNGSWGMFIRPAMRPGGGIDVTTIKIKVGDEYSDKGETTDVVRIVGDECFMSNGSRIHRNDIIWHPRGEMFIHRLWVDQWDGFFEE